MNIKRGKSNNNTLLTEELRLYSLSETGCSLPFHCETVFAYFPDFAPFCDIKNDVLHERNKGKLKSYDYTISAFLRAAQAQRTGQPLTSHTSARKCEQGHNKQKREWVKRSVWHFNRPSVPWLYKPQLWISILTAENDTNTTDINAVELGIKRVKGRDANEKEGEVKKKGRRRGEEKKWKMSNFSLLTSCECGYHQAPEMHNKCPFELRLYSIRHS